MGEFGLGTLIAIIIGALFLLVLLFFAILASFYKKIPQGKSIVRTGVGGTKVAFNKGIYVIPVFHKMEIMDISVKKLQIDRMQNEGLICKDNIRADIKVAFFIRVNKSIDDVINVAQTLGCERASDVETLRNIFEAKFSEALKTVGKKFEFIELYEARREFREEIINIIGRDLNGYILDDCAIDYLEQTNISYLDPQNILDSEGIKKITELTALQNINANLIRRDEQKVIKKQDVEAREAILELERQLSEKEEKQRREVDNIRAREEAEIQKVREEERLKSESVRISTEESLAVLEENKLRQVIIAAKNKERTDAVETERVEKDRALEQTERERIVTLAQINKEKAVEEEKKTIQDVIRERVQLEKGVVEEQQNIKDVEALRAVEREKQVGITQASKQAEENLIRTIKEAEAKKFAQEQISQQMLIEAEAEKEASIKQAEARKILADAKAREDATIGLAEAEVIKAKAEAVEQQSIVDAAKIQRIATAEAAGIEAKAEAKRKEGLAEAEVIKEKAIADAEGIKEKAEAMKKMDGVGKEHEEFKLQLQKEKEVELAVLTIQKDIAKSQADVLSSALHTAKIDIVGGETMFFENIVNQVTRAKGFDQLIDKSQNAQDIKLALLGDGSTISQGELFNNIRHYASQFNITTEDLKNLSIASLVLKMQQNATEDNMGLLGNIADAVQSFGIGNKKLS
ncbi:flotillin family protein [Myroides marinus]|uniref:flotillin family protein n=1 Tax=Myroides marinus TaxID=703342 RepID=UPI002576529B|nr:flotillin family protein [Myroides marinus]MDM1362544.1 flotillin family protein [Myroides marinus]MDM1373012.1 flotillin family protein [Myroides marinus]MDM1376630.1 flotillin family protein [Myroides marinus]MDM1380343.1 flotillin family protein [Myroides marinus]MDM1387615.1 flotillin family protein [Myroides marinus]